MDVVEYVFATLADARRAASSVPIPDIGVSRPGFRCGGRRAASPTRAVTAVRADDGAYVIRVPERIRALESETDVRRVRSVSRNVRVAEWQRSDIDEDQPVRSR